jgi:hypothetical protein
MRRILTACMLSVLLYGAAFMLVLDRPLSLGFLRQQLDIKLGRGTTVPSPKLVILAGSNGPYSHRCEVMEPILNMPCVNAGIAVGVGLDYLFARWKPLLHPGDAVYLPMEEAQYVRSRAANALGPDAAIMARHDRTTLLRMRPDRWLAALFSFDVRAGIMTLIETALYDGGFADPRAEMTGATNEWGDHTGHTAALGATNQAVLAAAIPSHVTADEVRGGYGSVLIAGFVRWAEANGVHVIGGLPTGFVDSPIPEAAIAEIRALYLSQGADFLELPNRSRYPRTAFFDTPDHLNEAAQIAHSVTVAKALLPLLHNPTVAARRPSDSQNASDVAWTTSGKVRTIARTSSGTVSSTETRQIASPP